MNSQRGFSLPETLVALLLFTLSFTALLNYQLMLAQGAQQQIQQREAWRQAWLRFEGYQAPDWRTSLEKENVQGCLMWTASAISSGGRRAVLSQLHCDGAEK
ncbi:prepilin-type N-terminal cleavage/methylation domain-containing protein [Erwinia psidii]|uniref:Prepilin-type N-terminal cleavage/methylation domain-containing protein n=1 Tax=Erwinia psidii TaxID=69224 RepID=A0A3N6SJS2_9GAMM|nr:prepilin-type N-terminal cleavage/methylation domain-containing protein [Erwinia psidii]MCX8956874.1 prepilin-type N-terminal cleavage/methylation domain-containing protein [Erwinia psidii]MCX8960315.1 prepilin-type N-terminal cleavage/methylation domain-containing protein [Erwinia psidii]MCX8964505.1 prepilin-type N-terminal cleavage/methylation domain-containing protein [Erwinia psidii]RQM40193.1 prepilin-type N-terminal cleavage/methylation domain-containing protein [Erwinia psidii]